MVARTYTRISRYWHKLKTPEGIFFGYSRAEVEAKASQARRMADIAAEEQAAFLAESDNRRGLRLC